MTFQMKTIKTTATEVLREIAGPKAKPKPDQLAALSALLIDGKNVLLHQAAGWGKSAVYWSAAKILTKEEQKLTIVVSPLKPLMTDQMIAATSTGLRAALLNGTTEAEWGTTYRGTLNGNFDILFVTPEHLLRPEFIGQVLEPLSNKLGLFVIDEAHCISTWGHDFRVDYQRITEITSRFKHVSVLATTATADTATCDDIIRQLTGETILLQGNLELPSVQLAVLNDMKSDQRVGYVTSLIKKRGGSGLLFARSINTIKAINRSFQFSGINSQEYHSGLDDDERIALERAWIEGDIPVLVTSTAFSMGVNKQDASWAIHLNTPTSIKAYYQEIGRVGRGGMDALAVLIPDSKTDKNALKTFPGKNLPNEFELHLALEFVNQSPYPVNAYGLSQQLRNNKARSTLLLKTLAKDEFVHQVGTGWEATGKVWKFNQEAYDLQMAALREDADRMTEYLKTDACLSTFIRMGIGESLDPKTRCERCMNCLGHLPGELTY